MSELKSHLLAQDAQEPDVGAAFRKMFSDIPVIDAKAERAKFVAAEQELLARMHAEAQKK